MKTEDASFRHAVELLRNEFLSSVVESSKAPKVIKQNTTPKLSTSLAVNADHQEI